MCTRGMRPVNGMWGCTVVSGGGRSGGGGGVMVVGVLVGVGEDAVKVPHHSTLPTLFVRLPSSQTRREICNNVDITNK